VTWIHTDLEYARSVRGPPRVEKVVLAGADEPLAAVGKLQRQDATLMEVKLILVRLRVVQYLDIATLHADNNNKNVNYE